MKWFKKIGLGLILLVALVVGLLYIFDYDYILKGIRTTYFTGHTTAYIDDYRHFQNRKVKGPATPDEWPLHKKYNEMEPSLGLRVLNEEFQTTAFLIIQSDSILYEYYAPGYSKESRTNSFSMAKSVVVALLGRAITEGKIKSLDQPVADFFPQFDPRLKVGDLASMASGLNWEENYYSPFSMTARAYFDDNIRELILDLEVTTTPGKEFEYLSGNTQLLAMVLEKATDTTLSHYLSTSLWQPMGMHQDGLWQLDGSQSGMEKAYCCIASNARNFARFGRLFKQLGYWNGQQLIDSSLVKKFIQPRFEEAPHYGYGLWLARFRGKEIFYMRGILGQYVIVIPEDDLIVVRLGKQRGTKPEGSQHSSDFFSYLREVYRMLGKSQ